MRELNHLILNLYGSAQECTTGEFQGQALDMGELLQVYAATLPELLLRAQRGELTDAKTLTALLWLQQTNHGVWPLNWQHHSAD